jgi:sulfate adenylyltransferase subunit 2
MRAGDWTELDIWTYILAEEIPVVPLYFAKRRSVVVRDGAIITVVDDNLPMRAGDADVRFRTLGCYPPHCRQAPLPTSTMW